VGEDVRVALLERGARGDGAVAAGDARQRGDRQVVLAAVHLVAGGGAVRGAVHEDGVPAAVLDPQAAPAVLGRRDVGALGLAVGPDGPGLAVVVADERPVVVLLLAVLPEDVADRPHVVGGRRDDVVEGRVGLAAGELHLGQLHLLPLGAVPAVHAGLGALAAHREDVVLGDGGQRPVHGGGGVVAPDLAVEEGRPVPAVDRLGEHPHGVGGDGLDVGGPQRRVEFHGRPGGAVVVQRRGAVLRGDPGRPHVVGGGGVGRRGDHRPVVGGGLPGPLRAVPAVDPGGA